MDGAEISESIVLVRLELGVGRAMAGLEGVLGETGVLGASEPKRILMGDEEICTGRAHFGITISTCLDLTLEESPTDLGLGKGNPGRLGLCETIVEVREELSPTEMQGLSGATTGS